MGSAAGVGWPCRHGDGAAGAEFPPAAEEEPGCLQPGSGGCTEVKVSRPRMKGSSLPPGGGNEAASSGRELQVP